MLVSMFFFESKTASLTLSMEGVAGFYEDKYGQDFFEQLFIRFFRSESLSSYSNIYSSYLFSLWRS